MNNDFIKLLSCPKTKADLQLKEGELFTNDTSYPLFEGIPWLFKNPEYSFLEWGTKIENFIREEDLYIKHLQKITNDASSKLARKRISQILTAKTKNLKTFQKTLAPFLGHQPMAITPSSQQIHSYMQLIFRDWSWDKGETETYLNFINSHIKDEHKTVLILGAGACGLSYELCQKHSDKDFISFDHNPFLFLKAKEILDGKEVKLNDFSFYPKTLEETSKGYSIKVPKLENNNHQFVFGSFPDLPFKDDSFDLIIAPWFFDIIDHSIEQSIPFTAKFLKENGSLLIFGPNNIHKDSILEQRTSAEVLEIVENNFNKSSLKIESVEYLKNPIESANRIEEVLFISAEGKKIDSEPQLPVSNIKLSFSPAFEQYKAVNETFYNILKHIKTDITADELAPKIKEEFGFSDDESTFYAKTFLARINLEL